MGDICKKKLGLFTLTSLVAGNMIGSGVFILPADLARIGSISLLSWLFTAAGAFLLALTFSKLSSLMPKTGGPYVFAHAAFGDFIGFQTAYVYWISIWAGNAAVAVALMGYLKVFFPFLANPVLETALAIGFVWVVTLINLRGVYLAGLVQLITTCLKFIPLLMIGIFGWFYFHPEYLTMHFNVTGTSNFPALSNAATLTLWAFIGLESATVPADSTENPARNIPLATLFGTLIATVIYIASSTAIMGILPADALINSSSPFAAAAKLMFGNWGEKIVALGAAISCFGTLNGYILVQGQVTMGPAKDNLFPKIFARLNKFVVPQFGIINGSILMSILLLTTASPNLVDQFQMIILMVSASTLLVYAYTAFADFVILSPEARSKTKILNLVIATLAAAYALWAFFGSGKNIVFLNTMLILSSFVVYAALKYKQKNM
jgi:basic amino acid/polyamine antiporter, APA family